MLNPCYTECANTVKCGVAEVPHAKTSKYYRAIIVRNQQRMHVNILTVSWDIAVRGVFMHADKLDTGPRMDVTESTQHCLVDVRPILTHSHRSAFDSLETLSQSLRDLKSTHEQLIILLNLWSVCSRTGARLCDSPLRLLWRAVCWFCSSPSPDFGFKLYIVISPAEWTVH